ncbi:MAG: pantothenate kinase [Cyanobacteria bacterium J06641_5]
MTLAPRSEQPECPGADWIGAIAGNSRLHWAAFADDRCLMTWDGPHLQTAVTGDSSSLEAATRRAPNILQVAIAARVPLYLASVAIGQTQLLQQAYDPLQEIVLAQVPLQGLYATLGIDRALALLGAGLQYGFPVLVIDSGTALTFTGAAEDCTLVGGAILPGLTLQRQALAQFTSALPKVALPTELPERWGQGTPEAIASGILYGAIATVADFSRAWRQDYPESLLVLTGGDGQSLFNGLQQQLPDLARACRLDLQLGWRGLLDVRMALETRE